MADPTPVLFTHFGDEWIRGSEVVLLDLLAAIDKGKVRPVVWCNGAEMAKACQGAGYTTYRDDFRHMFDYGSPKPSASHFLSLIRKGRSLCREHGVQVLHANSLAPAQWLVPVGLTERIPVLAHLHIDYLLRSRYALLLHAATLIVGVSQPVIEGPLEDGVSPERTRIIHNGIDFARLGDSTADLRAKLGISHDAFVVATAGSLIKRKCHDILIRAFHTLRAGKIMPHLIIGGGGTELDDLRNLTLKLGISERVHFLGSISDVAQIYKAADVFALASNKESFGLVFAEAGHFGLPVVSTRVGGIPEVVVHEETGLLTSVGDVTAFSNSLARLMIDPGLRKRLGTAAIRRVDENFTAVQMAKSFESAYKELAEFPKHKLGWVHAMHRCSVPYSNLIRRRAFGLRRQHDKDTGHEN